MGTLTDYTTDNPTITISSDIKDGELRLLAPGQQTDDRHTYSLIELVNLTRSLMSWTRIPYDVPPGDSKSLDDFTDDERKLYYPFAFLLACLDGNAFRTGHLNAILEGGDKLPPTQETISAYIPDAYRIIKANGGTFEEARDLIENAAN